MTDDSHELLLVRAEAAYAQAVADPVAAGPLAESVVAAARQARDAESLVVGLRAQAWAARTLLADTAAKRLLDEAARVARREHLDRRLSEVLVSRAAVQHELGRARAALQDLDQARQLLGDTSSPELDHQVAALHQNAGRLRAAATIYRRLLADPSATVAVQVKVANNLGLIEAQLGHHGTALFLLNRAQDLAVQVGPAYTAYVTEGRAWVNAQAGRLPTSLELFADAHRLYELAGLPRAELHAEHADAMTDLRLLPEAAEAARLAVEEFRAGGVPLMQAEAELRVARLALLTGDLAGATSAAATAEANLRRQERAGWAANAVVIDVEAKVQARSVAGTDLQRVRRAASTLERLQLSASAVEAHLTAACTSVALDRHDLALPSFDRAAQLARRAPVLVRLKGRVAAASAAGLRGEHRKSLQQCRAGLTDLDRHRAVLASTELRVLASAHGAELGQIGLRTLLQSGTPTQVLDWMERTRAAALLAVQRTDIEGLEEELAALRALQAEMQTIGGGSAATIARHTGLEQRLRRLTWARTADGSTSTRPSQVTDLRHALDGRLLVEYAVLDDQVLAAAVTDRRVVVTRLAPLEAVVHEIDGLMLVLRLLSRQSASAGAPGLQQVGRTRLANLRTMLLAPLPVVSADQELVVVPSGPLQRVPWSALHSAPVSVAPSGSFWARARTRPAPEQPHDLLVAGPGLDGAAQEIARLGELDGQRTVLVPPHSTVARVAEALSGVDLAHFACHGRIRADNPMFSGLVLADGSLTVQEIELRDLAPHRLVLAACEAASDVTYPGGEMLGFVSALLARGTAGLVASVIPVPDAAAVDLMLDLHDHVRRGQTLSVALHAARERVDQDDPAQFVNWCGFTAFGAA